MNKMMQDTKYIEMTKIGTSINTCLKLY